MSRPLCTSDFLAWSVRSVRGADGADHKPDVSITLPLPVGVSGNAKGWTITGIRTFRANTCPRR